MKKLLFTSILTASLAVNVSHASDSDKKQAITIEAAYFDVDQSFGSADYLGSDSKVLPGLGYSYRFDISDTLFIRPNISFYFSDIAVKDTDGTDDQSKLSSIHSYLVDFGGKLNDKFSIYGTAGSTRVTYQRSVSGISDRQSEAGITYGAGISYDFNKYSAVELKYQISDIEFNSFGSVVPYEVTLDTVKLGISYKF